MQNVQKYYTIPLITDLMVLDKLKANIKTPQSIAIVKKKKKDI